MGGIGLWHAPHGASSFAPVLWAQNESLTGFWDPRCGLRSPGCSTNTLRSTAVLQVWTSSITLCQFLVMIWVLETFANLLNSSCQFVYKQLLGYIKGLRRLFSTLTSYLFAQFGFFESCGSEIKKSSLWATRVAACRFDFTFLDIATCLLFYSFFVPFGASSYLSRGSFTIKCAKST